MISSLVENAGKAPTQASKGLTSERTGRRTVFPSSKTNSTRSPCLRPRRCRTSMGMVTWPLLLRVLVAIFTNTPYCKDSTLYLSAQDSEAEWETMSTLRLKRLRKERMVGSFGGFSEAGAKQA